MVLCKICTNFLFLVLAVHFAKISLEQNVADKIYTVYRCFVDVDILFLSLLKKREGKLKF